jgi:hypothetical protein
VKPRLRPGFYFVLIQLNLIEFAWKTDRGVKMNEFDKEQTKCDSSTGQYKRTHFTLTLKTLGEYDDLEALAEYIEKLISDGVLKERLPVRVRLFR